MNSRPSASARITGIALIVLPLVALLLKTFSFGWMMVFIIFGPIFVMVIGYVLQVIAATQGFLSKKGLFDATRLKRATIAAWVSLAGALVLGITMPDGGDSDWGSTLQVWLGVYGENSEAVHAATDGLTAVLSYISAIAWVVGWIWLMVEWIGAFAARRRQQLGMA